MSKVSGALKESILPASKINFLQICSGHEKVPEVLEEFKEYIGVQLLWPDGLISGILKEKFLLPRQTQE